MGRITGYYLFPGQDIRCECIELYRSDESIIPVKRFRGKFRFNIQEMKL